MAAVPPSNNNNTVLGYEVFKNPFLKLDGNCLKIDFFPKWNFRKWIFFEIGFSKFKKSQNDILLTLSSHNSEINKLLKRYELPHMI